MEADQELSARLTWQYTQGWSHLEKWHVLGRFSVLLSRPRRVNGDSARQLIVVEVNAPGYRDANVRRAIHDTIRFACTCEHDCCGHWQGGAHKVRRLKENRYAVWVASYINC